MSSLPDAADRGKALDTARSWHVEAPAGSGKTALLTARFLKLLSQVDHPAGILALTFTKRAAGEMAERCFQYLARAESGDAPQNEWDGQLLDLGRAVWARHDDKRAELASPDGLRIMTFDSFCHLLVRAAPLESGAGLGADLLDEADQPLLSREVAAGFCQEVLGRPADDPLRQALERRLLRLDNRLSNLVNELDEMIKRRDLLADLLSEPVANLGPALVDRFGMLADLRLTEAGQALARTSLGRQWPLLVKHLHEVGADVAAAWPTGIPGDAWDDLTVWQAVAGFLLTKDGSPRKKLFKKDVTDRFDKSTWADRIKIFDPAAAQALHHLRQLPTRSETESLVAEVVTHLGDLLQLAAGAVGAFNRRLRERAALDYVALEEAALNLFSEDEPTDLQLYLDHRLRHLLVDEFQDTSRRQWDLIRRLCLGWEPDDGRTVFVVGDPKQSIFRFRKAEVGLFVQAGRQGIPLPHQDPLLLAPLRLTTNFRSAPRLIDWVNDLFDQTVMTSIDPEADEVEFQPGRAAPGTDDQGAEIAASVFMDGPESPSALRAEADWLGDRVAALMQKPSPPTSVGVLLRARTNLTTYLAALQEAGVPVRLKEGLHLMDAPEAAHLVNLARALCRPHDDLAWAGLLRAPWSWFEISDLVMVRDARPDEGASWRRRIEAAAAGDERLARMWDTLAEGAGRVGRRPLAEVVEAVWLDLGGPRGAARLSGPAGVENCRAVLRLLASVEADGPHRTLEALTRRLADEYQPEDPAAADSPVQMMTIHGAKGLEFDVVFLPDLGRRVLGGGRGESPPYLSVRLPGSGEHLLAVASDRRTNNGDPLYKLLKNIEQARDLAEAKRLFYVALTRARRELYLSGVTKQNKQGRLTAKQSWLAWLLDHEGIDEVSGPAQATLTGRSGLQVTFNPDRPEPGPVETKTAVKPPAPVDIVRVTAQHPDWEVKSPSKLVETDDYRGDDDDAVTETPQEGPATWRGTVIHRLLETAATGRPLPGRSAVVGALIGEGYAPARAEAEADEILAEAAACLADEFLGDLIRGAKWTRRMEWPLEAAVQDESLTILSGELDLAVTDGTRWIIVDYKTGRPRPDQSAQDFAEQMADHYRPQLTAYRTMLARWAGIDESCVQAGLYLTAIRQWEPIEPGADNPEAEIER